MGASREIKQVEGASVCQLHLVTVGEAGNEGYSSQDNVGGRCIGSQEVARSSGVKDGPLLDSSGIGSDCFEEDRGCKCTVVGGGWATICIN
jgi:hypothetical protein